MSSSLTVKILLLVGKAIGSLLPRKAGSPLFFFFPFYQVGGAERIHADILACVADRRPHVFFTNRSKDSKFKSLFEKNAKLRDLSPFVNHRFAHYVCLGALSAFINRHQDAVVFGSNSVFFYQLLPLLKKGVRRIDLVHAFGGGIEHVNLPFVQEIDVRLAYSSKAIFDLKEQYARQAIDPQLTGRIQAIDNQVPIPDEYPRKQERDYLKIIYVGRGTEEKRVHLIGRAASLCRHRAIPVEFVFVGDVKGAVEIEHQDSCIFKGEIADVEVLNRLYTEADVLVLASRYEGFPMTIMEAMAQGTVPVTTDVGGISGHVKHGSNGLLIKAESEEEIVALLTELLSRLADDRKMLKQLSLNAYEYAREHFAPEKFRLSYRRLLLGAVDEAT